MVFKRIDMTIFLSIEATKINLKLHYHNIFYTTTSTDTPAGGVVNFL